MATTKGVNRPGDMENVYENRKTLEFGKIVTFDDKRKTLIMELSDGATKSMSWSTFRGTWRKKAQTEMPVVEASVEETSEDEYVAEIMEQKKELGIEVPEIDPNEVEIVEVRTEKEPVPRAVCRNAREILFGNLFICGFADNEGNLTSLSNEDIKQIKRYIALHSDLGPILNYSI